MQRVVRAFFAGILIVGAAQLLDAATIKTRIPLVGHGKYLNSRGTVSYTSNVGDANVPDQQRLQIEVDNVALPPGTELLVWVNEMEVGTIKLDKRRSGRLVIESKFRKLAPPVNIGSFAVIKLIDGTIVVW